MADEKRPTSLDRRAFLKAAAGSVAVAAASPLLLAGCGAGPEPPMDCVSRALSADAASPRQWPPERPGYLNPIPAENQLTGDPDWRGGTPAGARLEAYADRVSASAGQRVSVAARADRPRGVTFSVYRVGWYGGAGARKILDGPVVRVAEQPPPFRDPTTSMVRCAWTASYAFDVGAAWVSGLYLVRLDADGLTQFVPLIVTDERPADLLVQLPVTTWQAYNSWGGESLYTNASRTMPNGSAVQVSFDRPYVYEIAWTVLDREAAFVRFAERWGYDASYSTNFDVVAGGWEGLFRRGAFVSIGHDEYWAEAQRNLLEAARELGVPLLFFGANDGYWKIRSEDPAGQPPRSFLCYKGLADPVTGAGRTGTYRDLGRPESELFGVMYESWVYRRFPLVVANERHFLFEETGLRAGDSLPLLVGDEYDRRFDACMPGNLRVAARSPLIDPSGRPRFAETASYRAASGALVFAAGTIEWSAALAYEPRLARMTANLFKAALGLPVPAGVGGDRARPPAELSWIDPSLRVSTEVGGLAGPASVAALPDGTLLVSEPELDRVISVSAAAPRSASILADATWWFGEPTRKKTNGLRGPTAVVIDDQGNIYIADTGNHCIRRLGAAPQHAPSTLAGTPGAAGSADGAAARFNRPLALAWDGARNQLYVADAGNHRVRAIDLATGRTRTLAGSAKGYDDGPGATARFHGPTALALAPDGRLFVVCSGLGGRIAVIAPDEASTVTTLVRGGDGAIDGDGDAARLGPQGGALWRDGLLIVSDPSNYLLRAVSPGADPASTTVTTLAGSTRFGRADGDATAASFGPPLGLALAPDGGLLVVDGYHGLIRAVR